MFNSDAATPEEGWQANAACRGLASRLFFPPTTFEAPRARTLRETQAKTICATCTVIEICACHALRINEPHGIWGGMNESERRQLVASRNWLS